MNKRALNQGVLFVLLSVFVTTLAQPASADWWGKGKRIKGSGNIETESRDHKDFKGIHVSGSTDIDITIGSEFSVEVEAEDNILEYIETEVRHGILHVSFSNDFSISTRRGSRVNVTMPKLEELEISGSSDVRALDVSGEELMISISGSGDVEISGTMEIVEVDIRGSGDVDAKDLVAKEAYISIKGSGDVDIAVEDSIEARISGSGDITYYGDPRVKKRIRGSGDLNRRRHR